jgi:hypothetical protein
MLLVIVGNAVLATFVAIVLLTLLVSAIRRSQTEHRLELVGRRLQPRDRRRSAPSPSRRHAGWAVNPDAF